MGLGLREKKLLAYALQLSRGPHYDPRIGLPFKDLARSLFPKAGEAESAAERLRGKGLLEYLTPEAQHARLTLRGRIVAGVVLAGSTIKALKDRLRAAPERRIVTTGTRLKLCALSFLLYFVVVIGGLLFLMQLSMPLYRLRLPPALAAVVFGGVFVGLHGLTPVVARYLMQRTNPSVARPSTWWLAGGAMLGSLVALGLEALVPSVSRAVGNLAVAQACFLAGVFLGSARSE